ncbi:hypothetical protein POTOM_056339 [Populus tomentosa]|uniref:Ion transport domain-containing protein n=1 Tax=Populus tomentosa TaxID=118781 RepID=A0A8X8C4T4_POPTO|nr:hypothetical protein POTOM_056339 [Populus tomentosa]
MMFDCGSKSQYLGGGQRDKFVRLDDLDSRLSSPSSAVARNCGFGIEGFRRTGQGADTPSRSFKRGIRKGSEGLKSIGRSLRFGVPRGVFPEDLKVSEKKIFDPQDKFLQFCNKLFLISCILAVSVDPLFFYLPVFSDSETCLGIDRKLATIATTFRTIVDAFYLIRMALQFRTAYIAPSSRVFGRGELVIDPTQIAKRFSMYVVILALLFCSMSIVERNDACWQKNCTAAVKCKKDFLYCGNQGMEDYSDWDSSILNSNCSADDSNQFDYGIYSNALSSGIVSSKKFVSKYCYCLWWGLQNLSTLGQGLQTSTYPGEVIFSIALAIFGLILFALLIGNMQTYLQSLTIRLEEMRVKRRDSEQWMHHRLLPQELRERVRRYDQYKWLETRGVDEENLVQSLPKDLRRDIKRHLCLALVRRLRRKEEEDEAEADGNRSNMSGGGSYSIGATFLATRFAANALRGVHRNRNAKTARELVKLQKPPEPDFTADDAD